MEHAAAIDRRPAGRNGHMTDVPSRRRLGRTSFDVCPVAFGAFKLGRNEGIKYPRAYPLPDEDAAARMLDGVLDLGINLIDTAPAYGLSEARIGGALAGRRREFVLSTKVGETFAEGRSTFDYSSAGMRRSVQRSLDALRTDCVDILLIHSNGEDLAILERTDAVATMLDLRDAGLTRAVGFSGKTVDGALEALAWADVLMVEYNARDTSHAGVIAAAREAGVGVLVKKGLASGHLAPEEAIPFVLANPGVGALVVGGADLAHVRENLAIAQRAAPTDTS